MYRPSVDNSEQSTVTGEVQQVCIGLEAVPYRIEVTARRRGRTGIDNHLISQYLHLVQPAHTPRILHVAQPSIGGVASYVKALAAWQAAHGCTVAVASASEVEEDILSTSANSVSFLPWDASRNPLSGVFIELQTLSRILSSFRPDVVHLHSAKAGLVGRLLIRGHQSTIFQPHAWSWEASPRALSAMIRGWERLAARWTDVIICVGEGERETAELAQINGNLVVARNGVDLQRFDPTATSREKARAELGLSPRQTITLCLGRLCRQKGQDILLESWGNVVHDVPDALLALVGSVQDESIARLVRESKNVMLVPNTDRVVSWYSASDLVVIPSRWEGMSLTVLEAQAMGRAVIASDIAGIREALTPDTGISVGPEDSRALTTALLELTTDPDLRSTLGAMAFRRAHANFDRDRAFRLVTEQATNLVRRH